MIADYIKRTLFYFGFIQIFAILSSFLGGPINIIIRFFVDTGSIPVRNLLEGCACLIIELLFGFFFFKKQKYQDKNLTKKEIFLSVSFSFILHTVVALIVNFYPAFSGTYAFGVGNAISNLVLNINAYYVEDTPIYIYLILYIIKFALMYLTVLLGIKAGAHKAIKERKKY